MKLAKKARILSGQTCSILIYHFKLQAITSDHQAFQLPMVIKIGPRVDDIDCLWRFAKTTSPHHPHYGSDFYLIQGIIEKELRVLATSTTMEEMLKGINEYSDEFNHFMEKFFDNVEMKLDLFGLHLHTYGATIDKLLQAPAQEYYSYLARRERIQNKKAHQDQKAELERGVGDVFLNAMVTIDNDIKVQEVNSEVYREQKLALSWNEVGDYRVAKETEYLVITGSGIPEMKLAKKARILPGQTCSILDISRINYHFKLQAMTSDNQAFQLPMVITIGPRVDDIDCLWRFAKTTSPHHPHYGYVFYLIQGIIGKELRVLATSITMEEILKGMNEYSDEFYPFMEKFFGNVEMKLDQFGLHTYGATIDKLVQVPAHEYYAYLGRRERIQNKKAHQNQNAELERGVGDVFLNAMVTIDNDIKVQEVNSEVYRKQKLADARERKGSRSSEDCCRS